MNIHDPSRLLPPDSMGRVRFIDKQGYVKVKCGKGHPLCTGNGYCQWARLILFEAGRLLPGEKAVFKDGNKLNHHPDNLVAWDGSAPAPWKEVKPPTLCRCGCGTVLPERRKWVIGHKRKANPFDHLPVSRQRKKQLLNRSMGLCERCSRPRSTGRVFCDRCRQRYKSRRKVDYDTYYFRNKERLLVLARDWAEKNRVRQSEYQALHRMYGKRRRWPKEIKAAWDEKYPTRGDTHIANLGLRYERM